MTNLGALATNAEIPASGVDLSPLASKGVSGPAISTAFQSFTSGCVLDITSGGMWLLHGFFDVSYDDNDANNKKNITITGRLGFGFFNLRDSFAYMPLGHKTRTCFSIWWCGALGAGAYQAYLQYKYTVDDGSALTTPSRVGISPTNCALHALRLA